MATDITNLLNLLILFAFLFPVYCSQCGENDGVCSYQQSYQQSVKASYQSSYSQRFTVSCGVFGWSSCTRYKYQYRTSYRTEYQSRYRTAYQCCSNWAQSGSQCLPICSSSCLNGGTCCEPNTCSCPDGYTGDRCQIPICSPTCENGGNCTKPNTCECLRGYTGDRCQTPICSPACGSGTICTKPNTCECLIGHSGDQCQTLSESCPESVVIPTTPSQAGGIAVWNVTKITSEYQNDTNVTSTHDSGDFFPIGVTIVQYMFNNKATQKSCTFTVTVEDIEPPKLICPAKTEYYTESGQTELLVNLESAVYSDNSGQTPQLKFYTTNNETFAEIKSIAEFTVGITSVMIEAFDQSHNNASCEFIISITARCSSHITESTTGELSWEATVAGFTTESKQRCPIATEGRNQALATRRCSYNDTLGAFWEDEILNDCGNTTDYQEDELAKINVTVYNAEEVTEALLDVTIDSIVADREIDLTDMTETIGNIVAAGSTSREIPVNLASILDEIMGAESVLYSDNLSVTSETSEMVSLLDDQISHTLLQYDQLEYSGDHLVGIATTVTNNQDLASGYKLHVLMSDYLGDIDDNSLENLSFGESTELITSIESQTESDDMEISILLPEEVFAIESDASDTRLSFIVLQDDSLFKSNDLSTFQGHGDMRKDVVAPIISATVLGSEFNNLTNPVAYRTYSEKAISFRSENSTQCVFWDPNQHDGVGDWSTNGCEVGDVDDGWITCYCYHLSTFAAIVEYPIESVESGGILFVIKIVTEVGSGISIIGLAIVILTILSNRCIRYSRSTKLFLLTCLSLILLYCCVIVALEFSGQRRQGIGCKFVAACVHYFLLTTMFGLAFYIRSIFTRLTYSEKITRGGRFLFVASCVIWGLPVVFVVTPLVYDIDEYTFCNIKCFVSSGDVLNFGLLLPFGVLLQHDLATLIIILRKVQTTDKRTLQQNIRDSIFYVIILEILWVSWVILETKVIQNQDGIFFVQLLLCLSGSYFGVFIALLFCVRYIGRHCLSEHDLEAINLSPR